MAGQSKLEKDAKDKAETEEYIMVCAASFFMLAFNMGALMNVRSLVLDEALKLAGSSTVRSTPTISWWSDFSKRRPATTPRLVVSA